MLIADRRVQSLPWGMQSMADVPPKAIHGHNKTWSEIAKIVERDLKIKMCPQTCINACQTGMKKIRIELLKKFPELATEEEVSAGLTKFCEAKVKRIENMFIDDSNPC